MAYDLNNYNWPLSRKRYGPSEVWIAVVNLAKASEESARVMRGVALAFAQSAFAVDEFCFALHLVADHSRGYRRTERKG